MRTVKMTAKKAGTCTTCGKPIVPGNPIYWTRGAGARHCDCTNAGYVNSQCTACGGSGRRWNNDPCHQCNGTGKPQKLQHDPMGVDLAYEDACARACGL